MRIRFVLFFGAALSVLSSCSDAGGGGPDQGPHGLASTAGEIVGGHSDRGRDPAVVALDLAGEGLCSGALVAPHVVLTARHCVSYTVNAPDCDSWQPQVFGERDPASIAVLVGNDVWTATTAAWGKELITPPGDQLCDADIAFIVLDREVEGVVPLQVELEADVRVSQQLRAVGFGRRGDGKASGKKYVREHVPVIETGPFEFHVGEATCSGDSGGPALDQESGAVIGVVSRGGPTCESAYVHNIYTRADAFASLLAEALERGTQETKPACGPGLRCPNGHHCSAARICERVR